MSFLFRILSPDPWNWGPDFTPHIPLPPILIWFARGLLAYIAVYLIYLLQAPIDGLMSFVR